MRRSVVRSISAISILIIGVMSCEEVDLKFDQKDVFVAFRDPSGGFSEDSQGIIEIELYYASVTPAPVYVTVGFDATGIENPAVEGVHFNMVSSKTIRFDTQIVQAVEIEIIDNALKDKDKSVLLTLTGDGGTPIGMGGGTNGSYLLTIRDDEHPLSRWVGTYSVFADSYGDVINDQPDGAWDEQWEVTTTLVEGDETRLDVVGLADGDLPVRVSLDVQTMTITIPGGSDTGNGLSDEGYDQALIWKGDYENVEEEDVVGRVYPDGTIRVDLLTIVLVDAEGGLWLWDSFNTTWTLETGKSAPLVKSAADAGPRINKLNR
jgi:hypothetical protein